jgi:two-component system phosphate regulon sensor histidine kinase PhoR
MFELPFTELLLEKTPEDGGSAAAESYSAGRLARIDEKCSELGRRGNFRITVILPDGEVAGDSEEDPEKMENHADRPEIRDALAEGRGNNVRYSTTLEQMMVYSAIALEDSETVVGVLRTSVSVQTLKRDLEGLLTRVFIAGLLLLGAGAFVAWRISRRVTRPLMTLKQGAQTMSRGKLDAPVPALSLAELDELAETMNDMARQLQERISTITNQQVKEQVILSGLFDGVISFDEHGETATVNPSAAQYLDIVPEEVIGRHWSAVAQNRELHRFLEKAFTEEHEYVETVIEFEELSSFFQLRFGTLNDRSHNRPLGALLLIHDVTESRRMEQMRRDFVSSVSHELKTPITAIKGYVETLLDSGDEMDEMSSSFLSIIDRHTDRLNSLVSDLLSLSRIEYQSERGEITLSEFDLRDIVENAVELFAEKAKRREVEIETILPPAEELHGFVNEELLTQAISNLIDNALKYSESGGNVRVGAEHGNADFIRIYVEDDGPGIDERHHSRIFERFYRVDKARSRELGGTGLGLSIVKHIVRAHGGSVSLSSTPGRGSTFSIYIPAGTGDT